MNQPKAEPDQVDTLTFSEFSDDSPWLYLTRIDEQQKYSLRLVDDDDDDDDDDHYYHY